MREFEIGFGQAEASKESLAGSHRDFAFPRRAVHPAKPRMEHVHLVAAGDDVADADLAVPVGYRVVRSVQRNHHGAHLRMNVAEDERNARLVEFDKLRGAALIESEIETLSVEQRKHVVKKRILIRELDLPSRRDHQQGRMETLVLLHQLRDLRALLQQRRRRAEWSPAV